MNIGIIYTTTSINTKNSCKILSEKIKADVKLIPIDKAKIHCILKYNFIILAGSSYNGNIQSELKRYISRNIKTLKEKPIGLIINCEEGIDIEKRLNKTFSKELVESSFIASNFGYELNPDEGNLIERRKKKKIIDEFEKKGELPPALNMNEIDKFADYINNIIDKRVD